MSLLDDVKDLPASKWGKVILPKHQRDMLALTRRARQFIFDDAASRKIGHFVTSCPDVLVDNLEFAQPPYDPFYIEWSIAAWLVAADLEQRA